VCLIAADTDCEHSLKKVSRKSRGCLCFFEDEGDVLTKDFEVSDFSERGAGLS